MEYIIALVALTAMEIVLGIDNIVFIAIVTGKLPEKQQPSAQKLGLAMAMIMRIGLLFTLSIMLQMDTPLFHLDALGIPEAWLPEEINAISGKDLILFFGGLFLIGKSVHEIHHSFDGEHDKDNAKVSSSYVGALIQITIMDIVFSLDSVITAVGMVNADKENFWTGISVMVTAIVIAVGVMLLSAGSVSRFVKEHPTLKMLALSFLILIGVMLVAEGIGTHIEKGYIYFAMFFALVVEFLNIRVAVLRKRRKASATGSDA
ncbi:MAG TPA: hypothetical protein DCY79_02545 [Planctomycetaceae bacterium]|nr:hypothetical protein [Blastopirellula sp.]HAY78669.1 hypothetical protein [Planctomycetaceae bacterium]